MVFDLPSSEIWGFLLIISKRGAQLLILLKRKSKTPVRKNVFLGINALILFGLKWDRDTDEEIQKILSEVQRRMKRRCTDKFKGT